MCGCRSARNSAAPAKPKELPLGGAGYRHSQGVTYDDASWHVDTVLEHGLDRSCAATHVGMFFAWLARRGFVDPDFTDVASLIDRAVTPGRFLLSRCAGEKDQCMFAPDSWQLYDALAPSVDEAYRAYSEP
jgi:hypothetical protein